MLKPNDIPECHAILIAGPTGAGKSRLAMDLAARMGSTIINADAMQVYGCWRILTARPLSDDEATVPHALYGHVGWQQDYSVGHWLTEIADLLQGHAQAPPLIVGGTGLYFHALTAGLAPIPKIPAEIRAAGVKRLQDWGLIRFAEHLHQLDPRCRERLDPKNPARLLRAWEVLHATGKGLSDWQDETPPPLIKRKDTFAVLLNPDNSVLTERITERVHQMVASGALEECAASLTNWKPELPSSKAIGARELIAYLRGELTYSTALAKTVIATQQYAKRQRTWFRSRMQDWLHITDC